MKNILIFILIFITAHSLHAQDLAALTYNIRFANTGDGEDQWENRKEDLVQYLTSLSPDIMGFQEALNTQVVYLNDALDAYQYVGVGRDDGKTKGEYSPIFFKKGRFEIIDSGTFWLSETPNKISVGWDAAMERICTYVHLRDRNSEERIWIFNAHFDHVGEMARLNSAIQIMDVIRALNIDSDPVIFMGDLNAQPTDPPIEAITDARSIFTLPALDSGPPGTFNGFSLDNEPDRRIDYIFYYKLNKANYIHMDPRTAEKRRVSDHQPVYAVFNY